MPKQQGERGSRADQKAGRITRWTARPCLQNLHMTEVSRYPYLFEELLRRGYRDEDLLKVAGRNDLRAMRQMRRRPSGSRST